MKTKCTEHKYHRIIGGKAYCTQCGAEKPEQNKAENKPAKKVLK